MACKVLCRWDDRRAVPSLKISTPSRLAGSMPIGSCSTRWATRASTSALEWSSHCSVVDDQPAAARSAASESSSSTASEIRNRSGAAARRAGLADARLAPHEPRRARGPRRPTRRAAPTRARGRRSSPQCRRAGRSTVSSSGENCIRWHDRAPSQSERDGVTHALADLAPAVFLTSRGGALSPPGQDVPTCRC